MSKAYRFSRTVAWGVAALSIAGTAEGAQRTFVSTTGLDTNACTLAAPCRAFSKAITLTDPSGEIVVLDSGGYGGLTIGKSVTITSPLGVYAGISVFAGQDGIVVGPGSGKVVLRGLTINGQGGNVGIRIQAGEVHVENVVVSNMAQVGLRVDGGTSARLSGVVLRSNLYGMVVGPDNSLSVVVRETEISRNTSGGVVVGSATSGVETQVTLERSTVTGNGGPGVLASAGTAAPTVVVVTQSVVSENAGSGVAVSWSSTVYVRDTAVTRNGTGLQQLSTGVLNACGSNLLVANAVAQSGTINVNAAACLDQVAGGTVTNVATGPGLTGGPITTTGTIGLATTQLLPTTACAANQVPQWNGSAWTCAAAGGTVTSVATGTGLTGGPITTSGTISADTTYLQRRVSGTCAAGSSIRTIYADGTVACETDDVGTGTVTSITAGSGLTGGTITASGTIAVDPASSTLTGNFFRKGGNAFGTVATLGTTDNNAVEVVVNGTRVMRYEPDANSPNVLGGHANNSVGVFPGQTVAGGGFAGTTCYDPPTGTNTRSCGNQAAGYFATVGGGAINRASGERATVGGGGVNTASGTSAFVGGGWTNTASGPYAIVAGGNSNAASGNASTVGGGSLNNASNSYATIAGGEGNAASGNLSTVGGGYLNDAVVDYSTIGGGFSNVAGGGSSTIGGGASNLATGLASTVPGGHLNNANGAYSFAAGRRAQALADGVFVLSDSTDADFIGSNPNVFAAGFTGGIGMWTSKTFATGCYIAAGGGNWTCTSSRDEKQDFVPVNGRFVLDRVAALPITEWRYKTEVSGARHVGPMAQDFRAAFGLGDSEKSIGVLDAAGVALAAIQGLNAKVEEQARRIAELEAVVVELRAARGFGSARLASNAAAD